MFCFFIILLIFLLPPNKRYDHMQEDRLTFADDIRHAFRQATGRNRYDHTFIITDHNCRRLCLPLLDAHDIPFISIAPGEENKNLESLAKIWKYLSDNKCTRHSLIVNIGGGVITDMGSFAAATFKRGTAHINIPTTLLAMTDASTGGKTGIDFNGLKNEIGCFSVPEETIIYAPFLNTLNIEAMLSGYAEMLKHGLIAGMRQLTGIMQFDMTQPDYTALQTLIKESLEIKTGIVRQDPMENGCRKALNFGHTIGHALESLAMETGHAVPHGYAVAWGMALSSACDLAANALAARRYTSLTLLRLVRALLPAAALTAVMYGTVMLLGEWTEGWHVALRLAAKIVAGAAIYAAVAAATRMEAMREVMKIARDLLHRK